MSHTRVIAVDLDGTLAEYHGFVSPTHIGAPIRNMVERVQRERASGSEIVILTARVCGLFQSGEPGREDRIDDASAAWTAIREWCARHLGFVPVVTAVKTHRITELWDDRARRVIQNAGVFTASDEP